MLKNIMASGIVWFAFANPSLAEIRPVPLPTPGIDSIDFNSFVESLTPIAAMPRESHRVLIENVAGGSIKGSKDGGQSWTQLGKVLRPITGSYWRPANDAGVLAFTYLRGPSSVLASAANSIHLRFSDPDGYRLPDNMRAPLVEPRGLSITPQEIAPDNHGNAPGRAAFTDISGGTSFFGAEWSPKVGSKVFMGDGTRFAPIPYGFGPTNDIAERANILIVTQEDEAPIQYLEFENKVGGKVRIKCSEQEPAEIAKVLKAVKGIGRFKGSELILRPGVLRANHPGVIDIGTTDYRSQGVRRPPGSDIADYRGGFQVVPSHHFCDQSMRCGGDHPDVYMVVGPLQNPPDLLRYDRGLEGSAPLFQQGVRPGTGETWFQFNGDDAWYEMNRAIALGKFVRGNGAVVRHLRGVIPDALIRVKKFRIVLGN